MVPKDKLEKAVVNALEKHAPLVESAGRRRWIFALANGRPVRCAAQIEEGWLSIHAQLAGPGVGCQTKGYWELLCLNSQLEGGAKFVLATEAQLLGLRTEFTIDEDIDVQLRVHEACGTFKSALERFHSAPATRSTEQSPGASVAEFEGSGGFDLKSLCEQTGWSFNQREDGSAAFDLPSRGDFRQALVRRGGRDSVSVSADLTESSVLSAISRQAIGLMLLRASHLVRGVRAAVEVRDNNAAIRFGTVFRSPPTAGELEHALAALAIACDLSGKETAALQDEETAECYLSLQRLDQGLNAAATRPISESLVERKQASVIAA